MRFEVFLTNVNFSNWLSMHGLATWHVAKYRGKDILLLYRLNQPYGIAIEVNDRLQGHGYDIITEITNLPVVQYEILPEDNTMSIVLNAEDYHTTAMEVARIHFNTFIRR